MTKILSELLAATSADRPHSGALEAVIEALTSHIRDEWTRRLRGLLGDAWFEVLVWNVGASRPPRLKAELRLLGATIAMLIPRCDGLITVREIDAAFDRMYDAAECLA